MSRALTITQATIDTLVRAMQVDPWVSIEASCAIAGVKPKTFYRWRRQAADGVEPYATMIEPWEAENAKVQVEMIGKLRKSENPNVILHLLQARFPEFRFAQKIAVEKALPEVMDVIEDSLPPAIAERLIARISGDDRTVGLLLPETTVPVEVQLLTETRNGDDAEEPDTAPAPSHTYQPPEYVPPDPRKNLIPKLPPEVEPDEGDWVEVDADADADE